MYSLIKAHDLVKTFLKYGCFVIMTSLLFIVCWQVLARYVLNNPSSVSEELSRLLLMWLGLLGAAYTTGLGSHISIDLISLKLNEKQLEKLKYVQLIIMGLVSFILLRGGIFLVDNAISLEQKTPVLEIPQSIVYIVIPVSGVCMLFFNFVDILKLGEPRD